MENITQNEEEVKQKYPILKYFAFDHLPIHLKPVSKMFHDIAWACAATLPHNTENVTTLRKLLEAKDAAVRACIP